MSIMARMAGMVLLLLATSPAVAQSPLPEDEAWWQQQRDTFRQAREALRKGHLKTYRRLSGKLRDYPLYGYLEYDYLRKRIARVDEERIHRFLEHYQDSPISARLRALWLRHLARRGQWVKFLQEYRDGGTRLQCLRAKALFETGRQAEAMAAARALWLVSRSQPRTCDEVFERWRRAGGQTEALTWQRIHLAMEQGQLRLARFLAKSLDEEGRRWVARWRDMHRRPAENLLRSFYQQDSAIARRIVRHGIRRLARRDAGAAAGAWEQYRADQLRHEPEAVAEIDEVIALNAAWQHHPRALEWLKALEHPSLAAKKWRVRSALLRQDAQQALTWLQALPAELRESERWQYWRARLLEMQSDRLPVLANVAERIYARLARERSYHGFLSADRLGQPYSLNSQPLDFPEHALADFARRPAVLRARELFKLGLMVEARREWQLLIRDLDRQQLRLASVLASRWGWHDRAIATVAQADYFDDLEIRFPMAFRDLVEASSREQAIDPAWVYGVLRQESAFMVDARSGAGALGLMQLMPYTGRLTARALRTRLRSTYDILDVKKNIRLGTAYLRRMLDRYQGHSVVATASYNAGPQRVGRWMPDQPLDADIWVETLPYGETRDYVRRVMAYTVIYDHRLDGDMTPMHQRMPVIEPAS